MINFFTQPDTDFGPISATTGVFWLILLAIGIYLFTQWRESNPVRYAYGRRIGIVSTVLGGLGLILLALNLFEVPPFNVRLGIYLVGIASLVYLAYALYTYYAKLPAQIAAARSSGRTSVRTVSGPAQRGPSQRNARVYTNETPATPKPPRPVATTTRREARRDRKRRSR